MQLVIWFCVRVCSLWLVQLLIVADIIIYPGRNRLSREQAAMINESFARMRHSIREKYRKKKNIKKGPRTNYSGTEPVTVYVTLPLGIINMECELAYSPHDLMSQLTTLESIGVDGITVNICWGIVEANKPRHYNWEGYKQLFSIIRQLGFKMQVLMSFHECVGDDAHIPLPKWIREIGQKNPDIYFTDRQGTRNTETLTWGIDEERVLGDRTAVEVYTDYMRSFRDEFDELFQNSSIFKVEVGLGACGELRYPPSFSGEFQCYDKYIRKSLEKAAETAQDSSWGTPPDCSTFYCDDHDYDSPRGTFFLKWYSQYLIDHGVRVLKMAVPLFEPAQTYVKLSGMHSGYATDNQAERAAGFYDGYDPIGTMLRWHDAHLNFTCVEPDEFVCKVEEAGWVSGIAVSAQNAFPCYDRQGYGKILEVAKPINDPFDRCIYSFTYRGLDQTLFVQHNLREFELFVKKMHGTQSPSV
ncbi:putative beta-amylase [Helianthus anomalus]